MTGLDEHIPPGTIVLWAGGAAQYGSIPAPGWLYCDGSTIPIATYATLYAVLSTRYNTGSEPVGTFRLPGPAGYMQKGTINTAGSRTTINSTHTHSVSNTTPTVNTAPDASLGHTHGATAQTNSTGGDHTHSNNVGCSNNTAGNVGRAVGNANIHIQAHAHNTASSSGAAGGGHNHSGAYTIGFGLAGANHAHTAPTTTTTGNANVGTTSPGAQSTISLWSIIKT